MASSGYRYPLEQGQEGVPGPLGWRFDDQRTTRLGGGKYSSLQDPVLRGATVPDVQMRSDERGLPGFDPSIGFAPQAFEDKPTFGEAVARYESIVRQKYDRPLSSRDLVALRRTYEEEHGAVSKVEQALALNKRDRSLAASAGGAAVAPAEGSFYASLSPEGRKMLERYREASPFPGYASLSPDMKRLATEVGIPMAAGAALAPFTAGASLPVAAATNVGLGLIGRGANWAQGEFLPREWGGRTEEEKKDFNFVDPTFMAIDAVAPAIGQFGAKLLGRGGRVPIPADSTSAAEVARRTGGFITPQAAEGAAEALSTPENVARLQARMAGDFVEKEIQRGGEAGLSEAVWLQQMGAPPEMVANALGHTGASRAASRGLGDDVGSWWNRNFAIAGRKLQNSPHVDAQLAGRLLEQTERTNRAMRAAQHEKLSSMLDAMRVGGKISDEAWRRAVEAVRFGDEAVEATVPGARGMRDLTEMESRWMQDAGVRTRGELGEVPYTPRNTLDEGEAAWLRDMGAEEFASAPVTHRSRYFPEVRETREPGALASLFSRKPGRTHLEHQRRGTIPEEELDLSLTTLVNNSEDVARKAAIASTFGGETSKNGLPLFGDTLVKRLKASGRFKEADMLESTLETLMRGGDDPTRTAPILSQFRQWTNNLLLTKVAITQGGQAGSGITFAGDGAADLALGRQVAKNLFPPGVDLAATTGQRAGVLSSISEDTLSKQVLGPSGPGKYLYPMETLRAAEKGLRSSPTMMPAMGAVWRVAKLSADAGGQYSAALTKEALEMGTTPQHLARLFADNGNSLPQADLLAFSRNLVDRWQHQVGIGEVGNFFKEPTGTGATLGHLQQFPVKQGSLVVEDIVKLLFDSDATLRKLGRDRLSRLIAIGGPANAAASLLKTGLTPMRVGIAMATTGGIAGVWGDLARKGYHSAAGGPEFDRITDSDIPSVSAFGDVVDDATGGRLGSAALAVATARDPRVGTVRAIADLVIPDTPSGSGRRERSSGRSKRSSGRRRSRD